MKLHLGCGQRYLHGYVNIDYPNTEQSVQQVRADKYADIITLNYPNESISEIRSHHVFEHFSRPVALALVCRWRNWLKPDGKLIIETPDVMGCAKVISSPFFSFDQKQQIMRHLFGSHEADWAVHRNGWYKKKFKVVLGVLGFVKLDFFKNRWGSLRNIEVCAHKSEQPFNDEDYFCAIKKLLTMSTVRSKLRDIHSPQGTEQMMLEVWLKIWEEVYRN